MKTRDYNHFVSLMGIDSPPDKLYNIMESTSRNWFLLHKALAGLQADKAGMDACKQFMYIELNREGGPRWHIMDRLYKRYSNLRREIETSAMAKCLPEQVDAAA